MRTVVARAKHKNYPLFPRWTRKTKLVYSICYVACHCANVRTLDVAVRNFLRPTFFRVGESKVQKMIDLNLHFNESTKTHARIQWNFNPYWNNAEVRHRYAFFPDHWLFSGDGNEQWEKKESIGNLAKMKQCSTTSALTSFLSHIRLQFSCFWC